MISCSGWKPISERNSNGRGSGDCFLRRGDIFACCRRCRPAFRLQCCGGSGRERSFQARQVLGTKIRVALKHLPSPVSRYERDLLDAEPSFNSRLVASCRRSWNLRSLILRSLHARVNAAPSEFGLYANTRLLLREKGICSRRIAHASNRLRQEAAPFDRFRPYRAGPFDLAPRLFDRLRLRPPIESDIARLVASPSLPQTE